MVAHRYNLRFSTKEDSRKRPCAFRKTSYSIKRPRANKTTSTPVVDISDANSACDNYDIATTLKDTRLIYQTLSIGPSITSKPSISNTKQMWP